MLNPIRFGEHNLLHADKIAYRILLYTITGTIFRDFVTLYTCFMMANLVKKESNIQKVIGGRAESATPDRNRTKTFQVLKNLMDRDSNSR